MAHPARGDEMVNQEPEALVEAEEHVEEHIARSARWMALGPVVATSVGALLYTRGRRGLAAVALTIGVLSAAGGLAFGFLRRDIERDHTTHDELRQLDDERAAIETGER